MRFYLLLFVIFQPLLSFCQFDLTKSLPANFKRDGSVDYTFYIQKGINENRVVNMPDFPIMISDIGINIPSNSVINFLGNSKIILKPSMLPSYKVLQITGSENVTINNPHIEGDRNTHLTEGGEAGILIAIMGSKNVTINGGILNNSWADGIYLGTKTVNGIPHTSNYNITIKNIQILNSRRNGISIISVSGCTIEKVRIALSGGGKRFHDPQSGLGFEPNHRINKLERITVDNLITESNFKHGIYCGLSNWYKEASSTDLKTKQLDITVKNWIDKKSGTPLLLSWNKAAFPNSDLINIQGKFSIINPNWEILSNQNRLIEQYINQPQSGIELILSNPQVHIIPIKGNKVPLFENFRDLNNHLIKKFGKAANVNVR
jgi:hypothetical protein